MEAHVSKQSFSSSVLCVHQPLWPVAAQRTSHGCPLCQEMPGWSSPLCSQRLCTVAPAPDHPLFLCTSPMAVSPARNLNLLAVCICRRQCFPLCLSALCLPIHRPTACSCPRDNFCPSGSQPAGSGWGWPRWCCSYPLHPRWPPHTGLSGCSSLEHRHSSDLLRLDNQIAEALETESE